MKIAQIKCVQVKDLVLPLYFVLEVPFEIIMEAAPRISNVLSRFLEEVRCLPASKEY